VPPPVKGEILHWNWLRDGRFGVKVPVSSMWVGCYHSFRMTDSGEPDSPSHHSKSPRRDQGNAGRCTHGGPAAHPPNQFGARGRSAVCRRTPHLRNNPWPYWVGHSAVPGNRIRVARFGRLDGFDV